MKTNQQIYKDLFFKKIPWLLILVWLLTKTIEYYMPQLYYSQKSQKSSPDGKYTILEFRSISESGHAPYGNYLVISKAGKVVSNPENEMVIFAGYCKNSPKYFWASDAKIEIICESNAVNPIHLLVQKVYEISIEVRLI